ncbi:hypothetical protein J6590_017888 [Homalodisca vitripennis]|nr:hypothetical protein J6590_017888 [Homalodisca vitripennis]
MDQAIFQQDGAPPHFANPVKRLLNDNLHGRWIGHEVVQEYERAVIFRLGRLRQGGARGPGIFFILPCIDTYCKVDLRTVSFDVPPQEVLSRDSVTVHVDAVVFYRVSSPTMATNNVENYRTKHTMSTPL